MNRDIADEVRAIAKLLIGADVNEGFNSVLSGGLMIARCRREWVTADTGKRVTIGIKDQMVAIERICCRKLAVVMQVSRVSKSNGKKQITEVTLSDKKGFDELRLFESETDLERIRDLLKGIAREHLLDGNSEQKFTPVGDYANFGEFG